MKMSHRPLAAKSCQQEAWDAARGAAETQFRKQYTRGQSKAQLF